MRISDWSSDVCSSDLAVFLLGEQGVTRLDIVNFISHGIAKNGAAQEKPIDQEQSEDGGEKGQTQGALEQYAINLNERAAEGRVDPLIGRDLEVERVMQTLCRRSEEHTSELQSLMRISSAVFCLK